MHLPRAEQVPIYIYDNGNYILCKDKVALVHNETREIFSIVSSRYKAFQHTELDKLIRELLPNAQFLREKLTKNGARYYIEYLLDRQQEITSNDIVIPMIIASNSYDKTLQVKIELGYYRLICRNGAKLPLQTIEISTKHLGEIENRLNKFVYQKLNERINNTIENVFTLFRNSLNKKIEKQEARQILKKIFPKKYIKIANEYLTEHFANQETNAWDIYNVATYISTHHVKSYERKRAFDSLAFEFLLQ